METKKINYKIWYFFPLKLENEDLNTVDHPLENSMASDGQDVVNELSLSMQKVLEEPINLSVKKSQRCTSPSEALSNNSSLPVNDRMRQLRNEEGTRLFIVFFRFGSFFLITVHYKHYKTVCFLMYFHKCVFPSSFKYYQVLNPMEKRVWFHLWRKAWKFYALNL